MSIKPTRTCLTAYHNTHILLRTSPSPTRRKNAHIKCPFSTAIPLSYIPVKASVTRQRERGNLSSLRTKKLAHGIIEKGQSYPLSIWSMTSWTQVQMMKMGVPRDLRWSAIEFMFFGQCYQESPKSRTEYWQRDPGKLSPSRVQVLRGRRVPICLR
jgi:hypothetical protein